jgi:hypothetical protein
MRRERSGEEEQEIEGKTKFLFHVVSASVIQKVIIPQSFAFLTIWA